MIVFYSSTASMISSIKDFSLVSPASKISAESKISFFRTVDRAIRMRSLPPVFWIISMAKAESKRIKISPFSVAYAPAFRQKEKIMGSLTPIRSTVSIQFLSGRKILFCALDATGV